ncbi:MAG: PPC domain-containing protein [Verrucomicrobiota bacterium]
MPPSDVAYDFIASQNGSANGINLEAPEFKLTNYVLRVRTPASSAAHSFTVTIVTNTAAIRTLATPATKSLVSTNQGTLATSSWHYYRVEIPTNTPGWRVLLTSTNNSPDLYIQRDGPPTTTSFLKRSQAGTIDDIAFATSELTPGAYYIGVFQSAGTGAYTLRTEQIQFTIINWDAGTTHLGTKFIPTAIRMVAIIFSRSPRRTRP